MVRDFLFSLAMHPWLMSLREDIVQTKCVLYAVEALDSTTVWVVSMKVAPRHDILSERD